VSDLTWTCMVCGTNQPDIDIAVTSARVAMAGRVEVKVNVRYCRTNHRCRVEAINLLQERAGVIGDITRRHGL